DQRTGPHRLDHLPRGAAVVALARAAAARPRRAVRRGVPLGAGPGVLEPPPSGRGPDPARRRGWRRRRRLRLPRAGPGAGDHDRLADGPPARRRLRHAQRRPLRRPARLLRVPPVDDAGGRGARCARRGRLDLVAGRGRARPRRPGAAGRSRRGPVGGAHLRRARPPHQPGGDPPRRRDPAPAGPVPQRPDPVGPRWV
ncbi:MAG: hypothetical protein AVDCRST_MAG20-1124, partial [uncultured Acidimicrobiales bacterium]